MTRQRRCPNAVPKSKRFKSVKRHNSKTVKPSNSLASEGTLASEESFGSGRSDFSANMHDYISETTNDNNSNEPQSASSSCSISTSVDSTFPKSPPPPPLPATDGLPTLLSEVKLKLEFFLNHRWTALVRENAVHACMLSAQDNLSVQRNIVFKVNGAVDVFVHCKLMDKSFEENLDPPLPLDSDTINSFVDRAVKIVNKVNSFSICGGYDEEKFRVAWPVCPFGEVDRNPYLECRYTETFRSSECALLINGRKWRCSECASLYGPLKRRAAAAELETRSASTKNEYLTESQKLKKLEEQAKVIHANRKKIKRLEEKMQKLIEEQGVQIDAVLNGDLNQILTDHPLTPAQSIFMQQQIKASQKKNMVGMRWHPTMIRLALSLHITSPAAYELLRDTGIIKLPSSRTLFDYSRVKPLVEGIDPCVLESLAKRLNKFKDKNSNSKRYHVLMADEMYISQNLIFQKSTGKMMGYTSLDKLDTEMKVLEQYLENHLEEAPHKMASKVMVFMIKGVSSGIKEVVATFAVGNLSASQFYDWVWKVIGALERTNIAVIAFVTDGCSVNRAFIKMHKPITTTTSGVIFDAKNKAAPHRKIYFLSDVPHLLKTIRNNILNSRSDKKKSRRKLCFKGKRITWDYIIKLYHARKEKIFKKSYKLNAMNVFPDSYARMKVKYAAEALSRTVAQDMEDQGWFKATETINFIRLTNDWFDCLNGAHSFMGKRKRNSNLDPYTSQDDPRFLKLQEFLKYLEDWKIDAENPRSNLDVSAATDVLDDPLSTPAGDDTLDAEEEGEEEDNTPASKRILSKPTLEGIEMSTLAFLDMVPFLLSEGTKFINARIFTQDPLEQHFSKVRAGQGGSTNPNLGQVLKRNRSLHVIGQMGMKRRKGNSAEDMTTIEVTSEPLPKRKCERSVKFLDLD